MNYKLLVAEDISTERSALCRTLRRHLGNTITIMEAGNGSEALDLFSKTSPDIAILNIEMPFLSGLDVARKIRESKKNCPILFISDVDNFSYAQQAIALRALDYILKPYDEKKLIHTVQEAMRYSTHFQGDPWEKPIAQYTEKPEDDTDSVRLSLVREDIRSYIAAHYMEELSMKNAAHAMNYSDAYFCKLFKQCFHVNFCTYLNEYRIERAREMMENPRINVKDVGLACGYTDSNYFSRVFKRVTGQTPTEYRLAIIEKSLIKQN